MNITQDDIVAVFLSKSHDMVIFLNEIKGVIKFKSSLLIKKEITIYYADMDKKKNLRQKLVIDLTAYNFENLHLCQSLAVGETNFQGEIIREYVVPFSNNLNK